MGQVPTASEVWLLLDGKRTVAQIVEELAAKHAADPEVVRHQVTPLLDELAREGLLVRANKE